MEFEDFELQLGPRVGSDLHVRVLRSPAGEGEAVVPFPSSSRGGRPPGRIDPAAMGGLLFQTLFQGQVGELYSSSLRGVSDELGLCLRLRINLRQPELASLHQLPWELLYREATDDFLALSRRTPVVRSFDLARPMALPPFAPPLRLLVVLAQEPGSGLLDLDRELAELRSRLARHPDIEVEVLENPDPQRLRHALLGRPFHCLHYMGHGVFDQRTGVGALLFGSQDSGAQVHGRHLATKLKDFGSLRLVVLNACDTALAGVEVGQSPFAGVATALLMGGIPAVIAMQSPVEDRSAIAFSASFYDRLAQGLPLEEAITEGRQAIHSQDAESTAWAIPVLFVRNSAGPLFAAAGRPPSAPLRAPAASAKRAAGRRVLLGLGAAALLGGALAANPRLAGLADRLVGVSALDPGPVPAGAPPARALRKVVPPPRAATAPAMVHHEVAVGEGWRFVVTADGRVADAFIRKLRESADPLSGFDIPGRTVSIQVGSYSLESSTENGLSSKVCRLSAICRLPAGTFTIPVVRAQADGVTACEMAAEALAEAVVDRAVRSIDKR